MSVGVEPTDQRGVDDMAFVSIGTLASDVLHKAKLAAAAQDAQRKEGGSEPSTPGEDRPDPLPRLNAEESASNTRMEKTRGTGGDPATRVWEECQQSGETAPKLDALTYGQHMPPALPMSRNMRVTPAPNGRAPRPVARIFLIVDNTHVRSNSLTGAPF